MNDLARRRMRRLIVWNISIPIFVTLFGMIVCCQCLFAQSGAGSIQGIITDTTGAVIAEASVHVVKQATGVAVDTKSNRAGFFKAPGLFAGSYTVEVTAPGMKTYHTTVDLLVDQQLVINPSLPAGSVAQQVIVSSNAIQLVTKDSGTISSTLENARINQLPLNGRLLLTLAGETTPGLEDNGQRPNGLLQQGLEYVQDGAPDTNRDYGGEQNSTQGQLPDPDAVQELKIDMSGSNAEFATPATGIITTKSGTNHLHGSLFETARNAAFGLAKSRGFLQTPTAPANPPLVRNEFGVSAGGPIILPHLYNGRNKSFWFGAYERFSLSSWTPLRVSVPTPAMKKGDFSGLISSTGLLQQLYDPLTTAPSANCNGTGVANQYCRAEFQGNQIPLTRLSPYAKILYDILPNPTTDDDPLVIGNLQEHNFTYTVVPTVTFRIDHAFNEKNHAYLRYTDVLDTSQGLYNVPYGPLTIAADGIPADASGGTGWVNKTYTGAIGLTHIFSPTFYSETVLSREWFSEFQGGIGDTNFNYEKAFGTPNNFGESGFPTITGNMSELIGTQWDYKCVQFISNIDQNFTKIAGRHELHFGGRYRLEQFGYLPDRIADKIGFVANPTGLYQPSSGTNWSAYPNTGNGEASDFLGAAESYVVALSPPYQHYRDMEFDGYIQDDFHLTKNLTWNLGLRYEAHPAPFTANGLMEGFDLKNRAAILDHAPSWYVAKGYTTNTILQNLQNLGMVFETPEEAGVPDTIMRNNDFTVGPRIGVAYSPFRGGTVIRGGYGRYIYPVPVRDSLRRTTAEVPFAVNYTQNYDTGAQSPDGQNGYMLRTSNPVIAGVNASNAVNSGNLNSIIPGVNLTAYNPDNPPSVATEVNGTIEQALKGNSALRISWVWTHGSDLHQYLFFNNFPSTYIWDVTTGTTPPGGTYSATAEGPYDQTLLGGSSTIFQMSGWSNDNALQVQYQRLFHHGLAYQVYYVLSHPMRAGGNFNAQGDAYPFADYLPGVGPAKPANLPSWGMSHELNHYQNYITDSVFPKQHLQFNFLYDLPFGRGKRFFSNVGSVINDLIGGFQIAGAGQAISQDFVVGSAHFGATNPVHMYKHGKPITDCRSGVCYRSYLWFNGYIAPTANASSGNCTSKCVEGLPSNYSPYEAPINNTPGAANYGTDNVVVPLANGKTATVAYNPGPSANRFSKTVVDGPMNYNADASIFKVIPITEDVRLRFNMDVFNVFNIQGYNNPNATDGTESLQSAYWSPRVMQLTLRLEF